LVHWWKFNLHPMNRLLLFVIAATISSTASAQLFTLRTTNFGLNVSGYCIAFVDIDGDGDMDAFGVNDMSLWINTGTANSPLFSLSPVNYGLTPSTGAGIDFVDIDNDSDMDVFVVNNGSPAVFWKNTGTKTNPSFSNQGTSFGLNPSCSRIDFVDIDNDGDMDAGCAFQGLGTQFWLNTGTKNSPSFSLLGNNSFGLSFQNAGMDFIDIDKDGDMDVYSGSDLWLNVGTASSAAFSNDSTNYNLNVGSTDCRFVDIDHDGDMDAFSVYGSKVEFWEFVILTGVEESQLDEKRNVFPNPFKDVLTIETDRIFSNGLFILFDVKGEEVKRITNVKGKQVIVQRSDLPAGIYHYRLFEENILETGKVVAE
jgi:hypothetical protein